MIKTIGLADFPRQLLTSIFAAVEIDSAFVVAHSPAQRPVILEDERVRAERRDEVLRYLAGPYLLDPVHLACIEGRRQGLVRLTRTKVFIGLFLGTKCLLPSVASL